MGVTGEAIGRREHIRRQRWLGVGTIVAAVPVALIVWFSAVRWFDPFQGPGLAITITGGVLTSGLVLGGLILLARTERWSSAWQAVAAYALVGTIVWLLSGKELFIEGLMIALLWPFVLLAFAFAARLGIWPYV